MWTLINTKEFSHLFCQIYFIRSEKFPDWKESSLMLILPSLAHLEFTLPRCWITLHCNQMSWGTVILRKGIFIFGSAAILWARNAKRGRTSLSDEQRCLSSAGGRWFRWVWTFDYCHWLDFLQYELLYSHYRQLLLALVSSVIYTVYCKYKSNILIHSAYTKCRYTSEHLCQLLHLFIYSILILGSSVSTVTGYGLDGRGLINGRVKIFCPTSQSWDRLRSPSDILSNSNGGCFSGSKAAGTWSWLFISIQCRDQEWWIHTLTPPHDFMAWCLIN
jgi:hypothetical protein